MAMYHCCCDIRASPSLRCFSFGLWAVGQPLGLRLDAARRRLFELLDRAHVDAEQIRQLRKIDTLRAASAVRRPAPCCRRARTSLRAGRRRSRRTRSRPADAAAASPLRRYRQRRRSSPDPGSPPARRSLTLPSAFAAEIASRTIRNVSGETALVCEPTLGNGGVAAPEANPWHPTPTEPPEPWTLRVLLHRLENPPRHAGGREQRRRVGPERSPPAASQVAERAPGLSSCRPPSTLRSTPLRSIDSSMALQIPADRHAPQPASPARV